VKRITNNAYSSLIEAGYVKIPMNVRFRLKDIDFFTGSEPLFAGLGTIENIKDGRSYRNTAHCSYAHNQNRLPKSLRRTTIVLPEPVVDLTPLDIVHELGHALHEMVGFDFDFIPIDEYATTNGHEAFAQIFCQWCWWGETVDPEADILFENFNRDMR